MTPENYTLYGTHLLPYYSTEVRQYQCRKDDVLATVWDTPGLYDGTQDQEAYVQEMIDKCSQNVDLMIYCINSSVTRFVPGTENPEASVIRTLTEAFGEEIWKKTVIALTFANTIEHFHVSWSRLRPSDKVEKFVAEILKLDKKVRNLIITEAKVSEDVAHAIKIFPTGYYDDRSLPDREYWFTDFWFGCLDTIPAPETKKTFHSMSKDRIQNRQDTTDKDFQKDIEHQPIVPHDNTKQEMLIRLTKFSAAGVAVGGCVGAVSSGIGAVPLAVGALVGGAILGGVGYFTKSKKDS